MPGTTRRWIALVMVVHILMMDWRIEAPLLPADVRAVAYRDDEDPWATTRNFTPMNAELTWWLFGGVLSAAALLFWLTTLAAPGFRY